MGRNVWLATVVGAALVVGLAGCTDDAIHPSSLRDLPPSDKVTEAAARSSATPTPTASNGLPLRRFAVPCSTVEIGLPPEWDEPRIADDGSAAFAIPKSDGVGGVLTVNGTYDDGDDAATSQQQLVQLVQGDEGEDVPVQVTGEGLVIGKLGVDSGKEWRLAKAFPGEQSQLIVVTYTYDADADDSKAVSDINEFLDSVVAQILMSDVGTCPDGG